MQERKWGVENVSAIQTSPRANVANKKRSVADLGRGGHRLLPPLCVVQWTFHVAFGLSALLQNPAGWAAHFSTDTSDKMWDGNGASLLPPDLYIPCGTSLTTTLRLQASRSLSVATWLRRALCCICHTPSTWPVLRGPAAAGEAASSPPSTAEKRGCCVIVIKRPK